MNSVLDSVEFSEDLKKLELNELKKLSDELREYLIKTIKKTGGHFASNLGVVELTVALHKVFDLPKDKIIWDVGHQAYAHKVLTGRKNKLKTIRKKGGLMPFPSIFESEYDAFSVGHSSTSISAAIGMASGGYDGKIIAVIGDGALTGGMAFEALNHGGAIDSNVLVILNDNEMSISPNVGSLSKYLNKIISSSSFELFRQKGKKVLSQTSLVKDLVKRTEHVAKSAILPGVFFEELGWKYFGPIDAHDLEALTEILDNLKDMKGPRILHVVSKKGKGCKEAEVNCTKMHAISPEVKNVQLVKKETFSKVFSDWIVEKAQKDKNLHAITPAMSQGSGLVEFEKRFSDRYHDVGIAEQHAVTFAGGLACVSKKPVVCIYSTFLQRAYDQFLHDIALQNLDVMFVVDRAGIVGEDGATHNGSFDLSFLRIIPNVVIVVPSCKKECVMMLDFVYDIKAPSVIRYPRGEVCEIDKYNCPPIEMGKGVIVRKGKKVAILVFGCFLEDCLSIAEKFDITVVNMRFAKPIDKKLLVDISHNHDVFITVEDNMIMGGAGSYVNEVVFENNLRVYVKNLGLPDRFLEHGTRNEILKDISLDKDSIEKVVNNYI